MADVAHALKARNLGPVYYHRYGWMMARELEARGIEFERLRCGERPGPGIAVVHAVTRARSPDCHPELFAKAPILTVNGGTATRLTKGIGSNPAWSPDGSLIVYAGPNLAGQQLLLGVQPDGTAVALPPMYVVSGGLRAASHRFLPDGTGLVYMNFLQKANREFWVLNLATKTTRQIANLTAPDEIQNFDITPDGKQIVFDRLRENSDIVLIERRP